MFHFQQFSIKQERAAMKVGTDGVLLGAWAPVNRGIKHILDVGTGTGLIALMLAQRCEEAKIAAVEIDTPSAEEAKHNFLDSPWAERFTVANTSFQDFVEAAKNKYDLVTCNPPFFSKSMVNNCSRKAVARHNDVLTQDDLIAGTLSLLSDSGAFCVILPLQDYSEFKLKAARNGLFEHERLAVRPTPQKTVKRVLTCWKKFSPSRLEMREIVLEISRHNYSEDFKKLTSDFYLK